MQHLRLFRAAGEALRAGERPRRYRPLALGERRPGRPRRGRGHGGGRVRPRGRVRGAAEREEDALQEYNPRTQAAPGRIEYVMKPRTTRWRSSLCCFRTGLSGYLDVRETNSAKMEVMNGAQEEKGRQSRYEGRGKGGARGRQDRREGRLEARQGRG